VSSLKEIPSEQMSLSHGKARIRIVLFLQPDTIFQQRYAQIGGDNKGLFKGNNRKQELVILAPNSWIVGIQDNTQSKAIRWNELIVKQVINDSLENFQF